MYADGRDLPGEPVGEVEAQRDRLLELRDDRVRAFRQGVELVGGEIDARRSQQCVRENDEGDEQHSPDRAAEAGEERPLTRACVVIAAQSAFFRRSEERPGGKTGYST